MTDANISAMRIMYCPGTSNRMFDLTLDSSDDPEWLYLRRNFDVKAWEYRVACKTEAIGKVIRSRYGDEASNTWTSSLMAVDPACKRQGLGKAINEFIISEVRKSGRPWHHISGRHNVSRDNTKTIKSGVQYARAA